ncbi:hypothetical protein GGH92_001293 [Coemansia sp. RSA 2673]|nr:hypothetical protein GGH92_001293 [Coemansia sp. RSA 2673]
MKFSNLLGVIDFGLVLVSAQFAFTVDNTDADSIYSDIQAMWPDWAVAGNQVLGSAKDDYPDAWTQLAAIYGSTSLPLLFNAELARTAAGVLADAHAETTVWDRNAGDHAQYTFGVREVSMLTLTSPSQTDTARIPSTMQSGVDTIGSTSRSAATSISDSSSTVAGVSDSSSSTAAATIPLKMATLGNILGYLVLLVAAMLL